MIFPVIFHVDIPALDRLVNWLEQQDQAQSTIDALTKRVENLNAQEAAALNAAK